MKIIFVVVAILIAAFSGTTGYILGINAKAPKSDSAPISEAKFNSEVEAILSKKLNLLSELAKNQVVIREVKKANSENKKLTPALINQLDQSWRKSSVNSDTIKPFLTNTLALELIKFQQTHNYLNEIFVTDERGLNVGQTNKTSDYYQADEDWWIKSYAGGKGQAGHSEVEFDDSSQTEGVSLHVPIHDPIDGKVIGVIKALLDINNIKFEL